MFKSARWRSEKNKIKATFKLQFHATQVPQVGGDALMISLVPADVGKPTLRLEKTAIKDGSCYWDNSVYETVKFFREPKTGKIHDKIYNFVVSTGPSKAGFVGEASINFASYAESTTLSSVSLSLKNAKSEAVLHVWILRLQENIDQRETEEIENAKISSTDRSLETQLSIGDADESSKICSREDGPFNKMISHIAELNGNHRVSSGSDLTISSSDSNSALDTPAEFGVKMNNVLSSLNQDSMFQKNTSDVSTTIHEEQQSTQWEWLGSSAPEVSTDDSSSSPGNALSGEKSLDASEVMIERLKAEVTALSRQAQMSELELQTLRKQIVKESKRGQDLLREVVSLKEERDAFKEECENLKALQKGTDEAKVKNKLKFEGGDSQALVEELRQELNYEKDLNSNLRLQLQKTQESNSELILAVRDLDEMLEQKNRELLNLSNGTSTSGNAVEFQANDFKSETDDDEEQKALEQLVKEHRDSNEAHVLEQRIMDLRSELEIYRRDKDELEIQIEQLALDYEILKQENHDLSYKLEQSQLQEQLKMQYECLSPYDTIEELETHIENLESQLKKQSEEFSDSLATITALETHVKNLEEEMEKQSQGFEADLGILTHAKVEQEQRAIRAEDALRKMRCQNTDTAERLQEEFRRLSVQMASTFEANEKLATKALTEAGELRLHKSHLEELLQKAKEDMQSVTEQYEAKLHKLSSEMGLKVSHIELMQSEIEAKSKQLEDVKNQGKETHEVIAQEMLMLRVEIERLEMENNNLSCAVKERENLKGELEHMKILMMETEMLLMRGNVERDEMESVISLLRKEAEKLMEELSYLRSIKDEKESIIENLQLELENLKSKYNELKDSMLEGEIEKEKLRKQVFQLKADIKNKEDAFSSLEKKLKESSRSTVLEGTKTSSRNNRTAVVPRGGKEIANLKDKIKMLEGQIKLKETALETSTNSFLEKEKDLQDKIEELEKRLEELSQNSARFYEHKSQKEAEDSVDITLNGDVPQELKNTAENLYLNENGFSTPMIGSCNQISTEEKMAASGLNARDEQRFKELLNEMALLREKNKSMESELKEMQERYSEISLKFAEVEGERQQLIMTVRNLKNARKG